MKVLGALVVCLLILTGCTQGEDGIQQGMALRSNLLQGNGCRFEVDITADYGDKIHTFSMECAGNREGDIHFCVTKPESISGITGVLEQNQGRITFEETALQFDLLADGQLSPVSSPWILLNTLKKGYLRSSSQDDQGLHLTFEDSYQEDAFTLDVWMQEVPEYVEILWSGRRILTMNVKNFQILAHSEESSIGYFDGSTV